MDKVDLKSWVKNELVSNTAFTEKILSEFKDKMPSLFSINSEGKIMVRRSQFPARLQIAIHLLGAAYAKVAELRDDDAVANKEIIDQLKIKKGTVDPMIKKLREEGLAIQKKAGLHHVNYIKISSLMQEIESGKDQ